MFFYSEIHKSTYIYKFSNMLISLYIYGKKTFSAAFIENFIIQQTHYFGF